MRHLITLIALTACGTAPKSSDSANSPTTSVQSPTNTTAQPYTEALDDATKLPACTDANEAQLIYTKKEQQFQTCDHGSWSVVDIKGAKGDTGAAGTAAVANGSSQSVQPVKTIVLSSVEWLDTATNYVWKLAGTGSYADSLTMCVTPYVQPTPNQLTDMITRAHGTATFTNRPFDVWYSGDMNGAGYRTLMQWSATIGYDDQNGIHGIMCVNTAPF